MLACPAGCADDHPVRRAALASTAGRAQAGSTLGPPIASASLDLSDSGCPVRPAPSGCHPMHSQSLQVSMRLRRSRSATARVSILNPWWYRSVAELDNGTSLATALRSKASPRTNSRRAVRTAGLRRRWRLRRTRHGLQRGHAVPRPGRRVGGAIRSAPESDRAQPAAGQRRSNGRRAGRGRRAAHRGSGRRTADRSAGPADRGPCRRRTPIPTQAPQVLPVAEGPIGQIFNLNPGANVQLRQYPNASALSLGRVSAGTVVLVLGRAGEPTSKIWPTSRSMTISILSRPGCPSSTPRRRAAPSRPG